MVKNIDNLALFSKFIKLCAGRIGQPINISNLANDTGISPNTATAWLSILETSYIIHFVQPYHKNYNKRLIKSPKLFFYDCGVACSLLGIEKADQLINFHMIGNLFENMVVNELMKFNTNQAKMSNLYFWQNRNRKEVDIIIDRPGKSIPIEIKSGSTMSSNYFNNLKYWKSLTEEDTSAYVVYGGEKNMQIGNDALISWKNLDNLFEEI